MNGLNANNENANNEMNGAAQCEAVRDQLALLLYGELSFDEEECVEAHLDQCAACGAALERQRALHAAIDSVAATPSPALVARCRDDFFATLSLQDAPLEDENVREEIREVKREPMAGTAIRPADASPGWWSQFLASFEGKWFTGHTFNWMKPAGALALLAIGFMAARLTPFGALNGGGGANFSAADLANLGGSQIRNVQADANGRVNIVLNETRQRTVSGTLQDAMIRNLLVAAAKESADPGLRAETVTILVNSGESAEVRDALVFALENDQNTMVRWRAMDGLKIYARDPAVQTALAQVLQQDLNPGMRTQAIDVLTSESGPVIDRRVVGVLQQMVSREGDAREDDAYVRERAEKMLEAAKASAGVY